MKSSEELNALKEEFEALNKKLSELSSEELETVTGGWWYYTGTEEKEEHRGCGVEDGTKGPTRR